MATGSPLASRLLCSSKSCWAARGVGLDQGDGRNNYLLRQYLSVRVEPPLVTRLNHKTTTVIGFDSFERPKCTRVGETMRSDERRCRRLPCLDRKALGYRWGKSCYRVPCIDREKYRSNRYLPSRYSTEQINLGCAPNLSQYIPNLSGRGVSVSSIELPRHWTFHVPHS